MENDDYNISFKLLQREELENIKDYFNEVFVSFTTYSKNINGIFVNNLLVGVYSVVPTFGELSIDLLIFPEYRGRGLAKIVTPMIVDVEGEKVPEISKFYFMCSLKNVNSNSVMNKLGYQKDFSFDDIMLEEGGEFFNIYYIENPHYQKRNL